MMLLLGPSLTKKVPTIEARMQTPPITSGNIISVACCVAGEEDRASSMVATMVTA